jgi:hypothetical protein
MNNPDTTIEKVLAGLKNTQPSVGMESRILRAVQDHAATRSTSWPLWSLRSIATRTLGYGIAATCAVAMILVPLTLRRGHSAKRPATNSTSANSLYAPAISPPPSSVNLSRVRSSERPLKIAKASTVRDEDAVALSDTQAASFPAPPMPLTDQEKLLLRIAHKGDPVQLAMLDPALRARENAEDKAQFQQFFEPSIPGENQ